MDVFAPTTAPILVLLGFRLGGLMLIAPMFSSRTIPTQLKAGLVIILTALLFPVAAGTAVEGLSITPAIALTESLIGFAIGLGGALVIGAAEMMGDLLAIQIGISGAAALDPMTSNSVPVLGTFGSLFALTLLLSVNGHLVMIGAVADSLTLLPMGAPLNLTAGIETLIAWGSTLFYLGIQFAAPVVATVLLANTALAVLGRAAPSLNILSVAFPIQIGLGLFVLSAALPLIGDYFGNWSVALDSMLGRFLVAVTTGGV